MEARHHKDRAIEVARERGIARGADFDQAGVPRVYLQRLTREGVLQRVGRGLYKLSDAPSGAASSLAEASRIQPKGVIGLLSALQFHELTTQMPHAVWMLSRSRSSAPVYPRCAPGWRSIRSTACPCRLRRPPRPSRTASSTATRLAPMSRWRRCAICSPDLGARPSTIFGAMPRWIACRP